MDPQDYHHRKFRRTPPFSRLMIKALSTGALIGVAIGATIGLLSLLAGPGAPAQESPSTGVVQTSHR
ncbi:hypothetical protein [Roseateles sp.]|uniref:hypothetical protein n=1 Tax=Roseateles sp. TaxID=1971397 RepID=UPI00286A65B3|nr:hypothetical protein [Roseateles sp.]